MKRLQRPSDRLNFLVDHLDLAEAVGDPAAVWEPFQLAFFQSSALLTVDAKSRQVGWSWTAAADAMAEAILVPRTTNIFVSINQDEAKEKVRYAKQICEALDPDVRPHLLHDNDLYLELDNGSRLISHPCRPVRGKAKVRVYLDEFAHYKQDREIYVSALPATTRGGTLRIGSSPLGASGQFWEIYAQQLQKYPGFIRHAVPWWVVAGLCTNVLRALVEAPKLPTAARVRKFGTARLITIFENMLLEDFQQEYECAWVDESVAWISWEEIKRNEQDDKFWHRHAHSVPEALAAIEELREAISTGLVEAEMVGGFDVGRSRNLSEIMLLGQATTGQLPARLSISLSNVEFEAQKSVALALLDRLPVTAFLIDRNGLGMQIAEQLAAAHPGRAQGVDFTNSSKQLWSVELKVRMQKAGVPLPTERDLAYQIHSIKKTITTAKNSVYDTAANEKHHADKYWALALAVWAARIEPSTVEKGPSPMKGYRG